MKKVEDHPGHPWVITLAGIQKIISVTIQAQVRDPDTLGMHTYNDHFGYGMQELAQNLLLDFDQAKGDWKKQWSICEAMIMFFVREVADPMFGYVAHFVLSLSMGCVMGRLLTCLMRTGLTMEKASRFSLESSRLCSSPCWRHWSATTSLNQTPR